MPEAPGSRARPRRWRWRWRRRSAARGCRARGRAGCWRWPCARWRSACSPTFGPPSCRPGYCAWKRSVGSSKWRRLFWDESTNCWMRSVLFVAAFYPSRRRPLAQPPNFRPAGASGRLFSPQRRDAPGPAGAVRGWVGAGTDAVLSGTRRTRRTPAACVGPLSSRGRQAPPTSRAESAGARGAGGGRQGARGGARRLPGPTSPSRQPARAV